MNYMHNYCRRFATSIVAASIIAFGSLAHAQNLVVNPSFELGSFVNRGDGFMVLPAGSTNITGWTVVTDFIGWGTVPNSSGVNPIAPFDGSFFLDLQGDGIAGAPFGGVTQTLTTVIGQQYSFTFYLGTQEDSTFGHGPVSVTATAGSTTLPFTFDPPGAGSQWGQFGFDFTASSTGTPITIVGTATSGGAYIGLDLVSVSVVRLAIQREPSGVQLNWATNGGYRLEYAESLPATVWTAVTNIPAIIAGRAVVQLTNNLGGQRYFRLSGQ